jgi:hypothetical protein
LGKKSDSIRIAESRFVALGGVLPALLIYAIIDYKVGKRAVNLSGFTNIEMYVILVLSIIVFIWLSKPILFPKIFFLANKDGIFVGNRGLPRDRPQQYISWMDVEGVGIDRVNLIGRYHLNRETMSREPMMFSVVKIKLNSCKRYRECNFEPVVYLRGCEIVVIKTLMDNDVFIDKMIKIKGEEASL